MKNDILNIPVIDSHLHLWDVKRMHYPWLDTVLPIRRSFSIEDYREATKRFYIEKMIFVQADCQPAEYMEEVNFVEEQVQKDSRIQGMVAYAPVERGKEVRKVLDTFKQHSIVKGIRRMYDDEPKLCYSSSFIEGLHLLPSYGFSFDISIKPHVMKETIKMIGNCPDTQFILDHLGKPDIKNHAFDEYKRNIEQLAMFPNVTAKISGLITEADLHNWKLTDLKPYILHAIECFGPKRLMFGGDWPVVLMAGTYDEWITVLAEALQDYPDEIAEMIFYENAIKIYHLNKSL